MATQVRNIHGNIFELDDQQEVKKALEEDGVLVICHRSNIVVPMNSLNLVQAYEARGNLGLTTFEFLKKEIFMPTVVGKVLFLLHARYTIGTSKLLIPVPGFDDTSLRPYPAFAATLFGGPNDAHVTFRLLFNTARHEHKELTVSGGDILVCTDKVERTIPQTHSGTAFISETFYYPPQSAKTVRLEEKLAGEYMQEGENELERDEEGNVVWSRDRFTLRE